MTDDFELSDDNYKKCKRVKCDKTFLAVNIKKEYCSEKCRKLDEKQRWREREFILDVNNVHKEFNIRDKYELPIELLGQKAGVYFFFKANEIIYIGASKKLLSRLGSQSLKFEYDRVFVKHCDVKEVYKLEAMFIRKYKPKLNVKIVRLYDDEEEETPDGGG